jgi:hypothetical protein
VENSAIIFVPANYAHPFASHIHFLEIRMAAYGDIRTRPDCIIFRHAMRRKGLIINVFYVES